MHTIVQSAIAELIGKCPKEITGYMISAENSYRFPVIARPFLSNTCALCVFGITLPVFTDLLVCLFQAGAVECTIVETYYKNNPIEQRHQGSTLRSQIISMRGG